MRIPGEREQELLSRGVIDFHFDLPMELYAKRDHAGLFAEKYLPELQAGNIAVFVAAIYIEDKYLPDNAFEVARGQIARLVVEAELSKKASVCRTDREIEAARSAGKIAVLIGMEGAEPIGEDLVLLRGFYDSGLRLLGLTHARSNAAAHGGIFAPSGSSPKGLTSFGRDLVKECETLGVIIDLAHINPTGFEEIVSLTKQPPVVSHGNARRFYDIERNISDAQIRMVGERGGVIGVNSVLVSSQKGESTLDRYVDHMEHIAGLIGIDSVAIGFDFFEFLYRQWPKEEQRRLAEKLAEPQFIPDLKDHSHAPNLIRKLIERGFSDADIEKILFGNWDRILREVL
jgi:membrane dipeptidase